MYTKELLGNMLMIYYQLMFGLHIYLYSYVSRVKEKILGQKGILRTNNLKISALVHF